MANCCVVNCSNSYYRLQRWLQKECDIHCGKTMADCGCERPFKLFPFPKLDPCRSTWIKNVNRKDGKENWRPKPHSRICSVHFKDGKPTESNPYPVLCMGHDVTPAVGRKPPKPRVTKPFHNSSVLTGCGAPSHTPYITDNPQANNTPHLNVPPFNSARPPDHSYSFTYKCDCSDVCECSGCIEKQLHIKKLQDRIRDLENYIRIEKSNLGKVFSVDSIPKSDKKVRLYLGLPNKLTFSRLLDIVTPRSKDIKHRRGSSKPSFVSTKAKKTCPMKHKPGPARKLSIKHELILTLMKLRLNLTFEFLSDLFGVSLTRASRTFCTWVRILSHLLKNLIYHPSQEEVRRTLPKSFKDHVPNARGIIDCSEIFIERPNSLDVQAATWSDYKHHNTVKVLIDISPTGIIQFQSKAWGGRTSDKHVVLHSGYLDTVEPGDLILADRGFPIEEELILRGARLYIPPGARGAEQMTRGKVHKTKRVANLRIHVERAINRLKWFKILSGTLPISMVPLIDDILTVCSALINLYPPLVK